MLTEPSYDRKGFVSLVREIKQEFPNLDLIFEPGAAVVFNAGYLVTTVIDVLTSKHRPVAMLDSSFAAHMPDTIEMPYMPRIRGASTTDVSNHCYDLGGSTCLAGDFLGPYYFGRPLEIGDRLLLEDMMQYTMVKNTTFNGVDLPCIGHWSREGGFSLVREFGFQNYRERL